MVQNSRTANSLSSYDIKKPLGGLISSSDLSSVSHHHHPGAHAHAFSHYSQMGMSAAAAKTHSHIMGGGTVVPGGGGGGMTPPTAGSHPAVATHRSPITDFFGKMMSFSSCHQTPVLPSYYQNSMYSTDKIDSHLWFGSFVLKNLLYLDLGHPSNKISTYTFLLRGSLKKCFQNIPPKTSLLLKTMT